MTLSPGEDWGRRGLLPASAPVADDDAALATLAATRPADEAPVVALAGGDLWRTLGGRGGIAERLGTETTLVDVDIGQVLAGGTVVGVFVAHAVARGRLWHGEWAAVMNAEWLGRWRAAPRAHPGDGLLDLVAGRLTGRERLLAARRARTGDHLPHPAIRSGRRSRFELAFDRPRSLYLDGRACGRHRSIVIELVGRAVTVAV